MPQPFYDEPQVLVEKREGIAYVRINRPPVNAFNRSMYDQTRRTFQRIADDSEVDVVLFTGEGRVFCGGNELNEFVDFSFDAANEHLAHVRLCLNAMYDCPVPIVGAITEQPSAPASHWRPFAISESPRSLRCMRCLKSTWESWAALDTPCGSRRKA